MKRFGIQMCSMCVLALLFWPSSVRAWGCKGHQTVAYLAEKHLTPEAKQMFEALLTENPVDPQLKRYCGNAVTNVFADAATWADDERTKAPKTGPWHFIDIPLGATRDQVKESCGATGCVTQAIVDQLAILKDKTASAADRNASATEPMPTEFTIVLEKFLPKRPLIAAPSRGRAIMIQRWSSMNIRI